MCTRSCIVCNRNYRIPNIASCSPPRHRSCYIAMLHIVEHLVELLVVVEHQGLADLLVVDDLHLVDHLLLAELLMEDQRHLVDQHLPC